MIELLDSAAGAPAERVYETLGRLVDQARDINRFLAPLVDVMFGNEEDFSIALGVEVDTIEPTISPIDPAVFGRMIEPRRALP